MKSLFLFILCLGLFSCATQKTTPTSRQSDSFKLRDYTVEEWPNGLQVIFVETHHLPTVSFGLLVKDGSASDPMARSGLTNLMAQVMLRGTEKMTAVEIVDSLGQMGTEFDHNVSEDFVWFQVNGLSTYQKKLAEIFSDVILKPQFSEKETDREKKLVLSKIRKRADNPEQFADEAFNSYLFGAHPYARPVMGTEADLRTLTRKDLLKMYTKKVRPNNSVLVVTGALDSELKASLKAQFANWKKLEMDPKAFPGTPQFSDVHIRLIDKPDLTQTQIIIGNLGIKRNDPDYIPIRIANVVLGGTMSSRLSEQIRVNLGLTYGISSSFEARYDRGSFQISTFTKNETVGKTISETINVFKNFRDKGATSQEVETAKNYLIGTFPRVVETPEMLGLNLALLRLYGIGDDYLKTFVQQVQKVSVDEINGLIKKHFNTRDLKILVFTKRDDSIEQLRNLGVLEVRKFDKAL